MAVSDSGTTFWQSGWHTVFREKGYDKSKAMQLENHTPKEENSSLKNDVNLSFLNIIVIQRDEEQKGVGSDECSVIVMVMMIKEDSPSKPQEKVVFTLQASE
ncbi:unnamed protein product [Sphenostylis stenocarpa]|uniref:Uncharacterized protein n=1 Tax=Sphenostylis stenocarpa TaxID=92480 RepID=A0AA86SY75_9FABA|nr:unnamed protein product [Sphenostylis stenocarpa]